MSTKNPKFELTWVSREHPPRLAPRILLEGPDKSPEAAHRVTDWDAFENRLIRRDNLLSPTLEDKLVRQKQIKNVDAQGNDKHRSLFEGQDAIDQQREKLIGTIKVKLPQIIQGHLLVRFRWTLK